jgi:NADP-dependent 3-hydroxy acid dehydrogenase YdfG
MQPHKVFITGASSGIGEALARHYADRGAVVALFARREGELARIAATLAAGAYTHLTLPTTPYVYI